MKKLIIIILVLVGVSGFSQTKDKDTIPKTNEPIVSMDQLNKVLTEMKKKMTIEQLPVYDELVKQLQLAINEGIVEWKKRKKV